MSYRGCRPKKFILKGTPEELEGFTAKKLALIAAHYTQIPFVCETATHKECEQLSNLAKELVLLVVFPDSGLDRDKIITVATSRAMTKIIASATKSREIAIQANQTILANDDLLNEAKTDGWLSFIWNSLDVPLQAASQSLEDETRWEAEKEAIEEDVNLALKKIERHLSKQKLHQNWKLCLVSTNRDDSLREAYSLADVSLAITLHLMIDKGIAASALSREENPHLAGWKQSIHETMGLSFTI